MTPLSERQVKALRCLAHHGPLDDYVAGLEGEGPRLAELGLIVMVHAPVSDLGYYWTHKYQLTFEGRKTLEALLREGCPSDP
jgi:hypothetical protein